MNWPSWYGDEIQFPRLNLLVFAASDVITIIIYALILRIAPWLLAVTQRIPTPGHSVGQQAESFSFIPYLLMVADLTASLSIFVVLVSALVKTVRLQVERIGK
jgi:hypothetical protein